MEFKTPGRTDPLPRNVRKRGRIWISTILKPIRAPARALGNNPYKHEVLHLFLIFWKNL